MNNLESVEDYIPVLILEAFPSMEINWLIIGLPVSVWWEIKSPVNDAFQYFLLVYQDNMGGRKRNNCKSTYEKTFLD